MVGWNYRLTKVTVYAFVWIVYELIGRRSINEENNIGMKILRRFEWQAGVALLVLFRFGPLIVVVMFQQKGKDRISRVRGLMFGKMQSEVG